MIKNGPIPWPMHRLRIREIVADAKATWIVILVCSMIGKPHNVGASRTEKNVEMK